MGTGVSSSPCHRRRCQSGNVRPVLRAFARSHKSAAGPGAMVCGTKRFFCGFNDHRVPAVYPVSVPLTMVGGLETCILLALSSPLEDMQQVDVPAPFNLVSYNGRAFWNIVVC